MMKRYYKKFRVRSALMNLSVMATVSLFTACGGGGGADTKTGFGGSGDPPLLTDALTAAGPFSTIGVAGIAATGLDDRVAPIFINTQAGQSFNALKLGMVAEVNGTIPANAVTAASGTATNIIVQSAVVGPVNSVDLANQRVVVMPLTLQVDQNTIFEGLNSLTSLIAGSRVEAYGLPQTESKTLLATRLILLPAIAGAPLELVGTATNVSAFQLTLQGVTVSTATLASVTTPSGIAAGTSSIVENARVRVMGNYSGSTNSMVPSQVVTGITVTRNDNSIIVLDGIVQSVGVNGRFRLNDTEVETAATNVVTVGARLQVKGRKTAGVLVATDFRRIAVGERLQFVVQGEIGSVMSSANFRVRGESINATTASFVGGTAADLVAGRVVRIKAQLNAGRLEATEVSFITG